VEGQRTKLLVGLVLLAVVVIASVALSILLGSFENKGITNTVPWTPRPTITTTKEIIMLSKPSPTIDDPERPTLVVDPAINCTRSEMYWGNHTDVWPSKVTIGNLTYTKDEVTEIFDNQSGDVAAGLFVQLHTAFLNSVSGADYSAVYQTILDAANWIRINHVGSEISEIDQENGISFEKILADYNEGRLGPGSCPAEPTPSPAPATLTPTMTATPTVVLYTPRSPTATQESGKPHNPSKKPNPSPRPTSQPTKKPDDTSVPPPTKAPTSVPHPTIPPPTPAPINPP
jgi:hypothetical protein